MKRNPNNGRRRPSNYYSKIIIDIIRDEVMEQSRNSIKKFVLSTTTDMSNTNVPHDLMMQQDNETTVK